MLEQEAYVVLHHGLRDERLEHQAVDTLLLQTCTPPQKARVLSSSEDGKIPKEPFLHHLGVH